MGSAGVGGGVAHWGALVALAVCSFLHSGGAQDVTHPAEVNALHAIRRSFIDPMNRLSSWNKGDPCRREWRGITCNKTATDGYLHIQELHLLNMNLSGTLAPELGQLSHLEILDVMWNNISGGIPKEIGNIKSLLLLLLNGNKLSGLLPDELGNLSNLDRLQIDENNISGPLPKSFINMKKVEHLHMNNNSISGEVPPELGRLPKLLHFLLDNNNLSGYLPEFPASKNLLIVQLDNNNFSGSSIPDSYGKMKSAVKISLRNCNLQGRVPDLSLLPNLTYLDLSWNLLSGSLPSNKLSQNITTIDLSNNYLNGSIPLNFSNFPVLQFLLLGNNLLTGSLSSAIWDNMSFGANESLIVDVQYNNLSEISGDLKHPPQVIIMLQGNQICSNVNGANLAKACGSNYVNRFPGGSTNFGGACSPSKCPAEGFFEYVPAAPVSCYCAAPVGVGYRLKSPGISEFRPYLDTFKKELAQDLSLMWYQLHIDSYIWERGPRLRMYLKLFPNLLQVFNESEVRRIKENLAGWKIHNRNIFGPYELLNFTLRGPYKNFDLDDPEHSNKGVLIGILLGIVAVITVCSVIIIIIMKRRIRNKYMTYQRPSWIKIDGLKGFTFEEIAQSTDRFSNSTKVGRGGYGSVYKGILADGRVVAIKRAEEGSLQGSKEFCTELEFLSRLHHRNLVSLVGYCNEESEQMLIYEFMPNGTLRDHLSERSKRPLDFSMRLHIALGAARGILYLHTEADPPVFHRDIKASNILLDSNFNPKVADFGLSRLAPTPNDEGIVDGHVSTVVKGTPGYLDPEYFLTQRMTDKSDVYSLGVVFLELLTGRQPISIGRNIVREVRMLHRRGQLSSVVDRRMGSCSPECLEKFATLSLRCCDENMEARPSMSRVVQELENLCKMIPIPDFTSPSSFACPSSDSLLPSSGDLFRSSATSESNTRNDSDSAIFPR